MSNIIPDFGGNVEDSSFNQLNGDKGVDDRVGNSPRIYGCEGIVLLKLKSTG